MLQAGPAAAGGHAVRVEDVPNPEVSERVSRRTYTARYKLEILAEYERRNKAGKGGSLSGSKRQTSVYPGSWTVHVTFRPPRPFPGRHPVV
jgi:hypothetical protein